MSSISEKVELACSHVDEQETFALLREMVNIPSPSGEEHRLAEFLARYMSANGLDASVQEVRGTQSNAIAFTGKASQQPTLMYYSPIDTAFRGDREEDEPWIDLRSRPDLVPRAIVDGDVMVGLGAHNPKGHAACAIMAAIGLARARLLKSSNVCVALGGGGMPTTSFGAHGPVPAIGHGTGCKHLLASGVVPRNVVVSKPSTVSFEEVGVAWFRVAVEGVLGYAGTRHRMKHRNPIVDAAQVVQELEAWFPEYTKANTSGAVAPQGSIGAIRGGWPNKPTFIPGVCEIYLDLRVSPRVTVSSVEEQFGDAIAAIRARNPGIRISWEMLHGDPGTHTDPESDVIAAAIKAWDFATGTNYVPEEQGSGATEAGVFRQAGIPTVKIGMPPPPEKLPHSGQFSMGEVHRQSMVRLTRALMYVALFLDSHQKRT